MNRLMKWLVALSAVATVHAQAPLKATIPFDFIVRGQTMPAGEYRLGHFLSSNTLSVCAENTDATVSFFTEPVQTLGVVDSAKLVFHRYGNRYFLYQVWTGDSRYGLQLPESKLEREMTARKEAPSKTIVAIR